MNQSKSLRGLTQKISDIETLEQIIQLFTSSTERI